MLEDTEHARWAWSSSVTDDGPGLWSWSGEGPDHSNTVKIMDLEADIATFVDLVPEWEHEYDFIGGRGDRLFFMTDEKASRTRR